MSKLIDLTGQRFDRLIVLERGSKKKSPGGQSRTMWKCQCDCGNVKEIWGPSLKEGRIKSCGCLLKETLKKPKKHGGSKERLYKIWGEMKRRCNNPNCNRYKIYGARGIKVCDEWLHDYNAFREWSLANGYDPEAKRGECTLDRIDNDGNYEPSNCRWVSMKVQCANRHSKGYCD